MFAWPSESNVAWAQPFSAVDSKCFGSTSVTTLAVACTPQFRKMLHPRKSSHGLSLAYTRKWLISSDEPQALAKRLKSRRLAREVYEHAKLEQPACPCRSQMILQAAFKLETLIIHVHDRVPGKAWQKIGSTRYSLAKHIQACSPCIRPLNRSSHRAPSEWHGAYPLTLISSSPEREISSTSSLHPTHMEVRRSSSSSSLRVSKGTRPGKIDVFTRLSGAGATWIVFTFACLTLTFLLVCPRRGVLAPLPMMPRDPTSSGWVLGAVYRAIGKTRQDICHEAIYCWLRKVIPQKLLGVGSHPSYTCVSHGSTRNGLGRRRTHLPPKLRLHRTGS